MAIDRRKSNHPGNSTDEGGQYSTDSPGLPTLLVCMVLFLGLSYICLPLSAAQDLEPGLFATLHTLLADWTQVVLQHWVVGPAALGLVVTLTTLAVLQYDTTGGPRLKSTPSLHLGEILAVMNGGLMFLYALFYNIRVKDQGSIIN